MSRDRLWFGAACLIVITTVAGCGGPEKPDASAARPTFAGRRLTAAVIGAAPLIPILQAQRGEWAASTGAEVTFRDQVVTPDALDGVDVVVFPGERMGDLVDRGVLLVLPDDAVRPLPPVAPEGEETPVLPPDTFALNEIAAAFRDQAAKYGSERMALPIGGSSLVLAFRRDAFDRPENKAAAKAAGIALEPPRTWADLDALAKFFHGRDWDGDGKPDSGIALGWGVDPEGVGDDTFLARAAGLGQHRDQYSFLFDSDKMRPRVASPPFVEALQGLVDLKKFGPPGADSMTIDAAREAFRTGKSALLIDRAERASTWSTGKPVGVAPLPGSPRVFNPDRNQWETPGPVNQPSYLPKGGGWLVGVVAKSSDRGAAVDLAKYLAGPDVTNRVRSEAGFVMLPTRSPQLGQGLGDPKATPGVESRSWSDAVGKTINAARVVIGLRIPEADGYLDDLSQGRAEANRGKPAAEALGGVAKAWDARTDRLGRDRQVWHYRRSLNSLVTTPTPPPR